MRLIVDANILFSGILNSQGKIGDLLINSRKHLEFIAPNFLGEEIHHHYPKLCKISGLTLEEVRESEYHVCRAGTTKKSCNKSWYDKTAYNIGFATTLANGIKSAFVRYSLL